MNAIKLNNDQYLIEVKIMMKKIQQTKQYLNAKICMLPQPSPKNNYRKRLLIKICESEASKTSVFYCVEENQWQKN